MTLKELTNEENLPGVLKKLAYNTLDDMYAAIGYGGVTSRTSSAACARRSRRFSSSIRPTVRRRCPSRRASPRPRVPPSPARAGGEQGIVVEGLDNCLVKFSKCCTPVPGDEIVGFITRGYGVSVHRRDCPNAAPERRRPEEAGRWIKVSWGTNTRESYRTALQVVAK